MRRCRPRTFASDTRRVTLRLPEELVAELEQEAAASGHSVSSLVALTLQMWGAVIG